MAMFKCCACDRKLTVEDVKTDTGMCPECRKEHEAR